MYIKRENLMSYDELSDKQKNWIKDVNNKELKIYNTWSDGEPHIVNIQYNEGVGYVELACGYRILIV